MTLAVYDAPSGVRVWAKTIDEAPDALTAQIDRTVSAWGTELLPALTKVRGNLPVLSKTSGLAEVIIADVALSDVFPAQIAHYATSPIGTITLHHSDKLALAASALTLSIFIPEAISFPSEMRIETLAAGGKTTLPISVHLDAAKIQALRGQTPAQAEIRLEYKLGEGKQASTRIVPVLLRGRDALAWSDERSIAAFVTPEEESIRNVARAAAKASAGRGTSLQQTATAIAEWRALSALGIRYVKDPEIPARGSVIDAVSVARDTLKSRAGDCDDLSVLYASALEAVGIETALVLLPGHVLPAFSPGPSPGSASLLTTVASRVLVKDGRACIPIEATLIGGSFVDAWQSAADIIGRTKSSDVTVVALHDAWLAYPSTPLPGQPVDVAVDSGSIEPDVNDTLAALEMRRASEIDARIGALAGVVASGSANDVSELAWLMALRTDRTDWGATRQGWSAGKEVAVIFGNAESLSSGCKSRPVTAEQGRPVARLATSGATLLPAMRRCASEWAV